MKLEGASSPICPSLLQEEKKNDQLERAFALIKLNTQASALLTVVGRTAAGS